MRAISKTELLFQKFWACRKFSTNARRIP